MDNPDRVEMQALCDQFRELMMREVEAPLFDHDVRQRIGEMISSVMRNGESQFAYSAPRPR